MVYFQRVIVSGRIGGIGSRWKQIYSEERWFAQFIMHGAHIIGPVFSFDLMFHIYYSIINTTNGRTICNFIKSSKFKY